MSVVEGLEYLGVGYPGGGGGVTLPCDLSHDAGDVTDRMIVTCENITCRREFVTICAFAVS